MKKPWVYLITLFSSIHLLVGQSLAKIIFSGMSFTRPEVREHADASRKQAAHKETLAKPCQSAGDYYELGYALLALDRDDEAFRAFMRSLEFDPLDLDIYDDD